MEERSLKPETGRGQGGGEREGGGGGSRKAKENEEENALSYSTNFQTRLHLPGRRDWHHRKRQCLPSPAGFWQGTGQVSHGSQGFAWISSFTPNNPLREMFLRLHSFFFFFFYRITEYSSTCYTAGKRNKTRLPRVSVDSFSNAWVLTKE